MLAFMVSEVVRFFTTFGMMLGIFVVVGTILDYQFRAEPEHSYWVGFINLYRAFNGNQILTEYISLGG